VIPITYNGSVDIDEGEKSIQLIHNGPGIEEYKRKHGIRAGTSTNKGTRIKRLIPTIVGAYCPAYG